MKEFYILIFVSMLLFSNTVLGEKTNVFVSILPQKYFVERVGGDLVTVEVMVKPGQNPVTYEPTPKQITQLANTNLYFKIDVPFEKAWISKIQINNKDLKIIECCEVSASDVSSLDYVHEHEVHGDPHIWTSPLEVIKLVKKIKDNLIVVDSNNTKKYVINADTFIDELLHLHKEIIQKTSKLTKKDFLVSHPSWSFFAREYGFSQISIEKNGKEIQANALSKLIDEAREKDIKTIFVQPQFNDKAAEIIAKELGLKLAMLDPLAYDYISNMRRVTEKIIQGLSDE